MVSWFEVFISAFILQLLALPGEKGQLVIAALATKYSPYIVVAGLFVVFAVWIVYPAALDSDSTEPTTIAIDGLDDKFDILPPRYEGFVASFSLMVFGEFGDKTQLITIGLAVQYGAHSAIWFGEMLAIIPVSLLTAVFFSRTARFINTRWAR